MKASPKLLIAICCLSVCYSSLAQISPPLDFNWKIKSKETVTTFYVIDQSMPITTLDQSQLKKTLEIRDVEKYYTSDYKMPFTVIKKIITHNIYKDWMIKPAEFIIDSIGINSYDSLGNLLKSISHSDKYNQAIENNSGNVFISLQETVNNHIQNEPGNVSISSTGKTIVTRTDATFIYDLEENTKSIIRNDLNGDTSNTVNIRYVPVNSIYPSYPNQEDLIPIYKKEVNRAFLPSDACVKFVTLKQYEDYEIYEGANSSYRISEKASDLKWYPNPARSLITILNKEQFDLIVKIYNLQGQLIKNINLSDKKEINISELQSGIYLLSIKSREDESISKLIKL